MPKFIRTKDGIENLVYDSKFEYYVTMHTETIISKDHIGMYRTADTIDELCDKVVYIGKDGYKTILHKTFAFEDNDRPYYKCELTSETGWHRSCKEWLEDGDLYLAIWTSKGLIYVAKINDKGELELI